MGMHRAVAGWPVAGSPAGGDGMLHRLWGHFVPQTK